MGLSAPTNLGGSLKNGVSRSEEPRKRSSKNEQPQLGNSCPFWPNLVDDCGPRCLFSIKPVASLASIRTIQPDDTEDV